MERIAVDLSGVPQTLLWNLGRRAEVARSGGSLLRDPRAVEVVDRLDYDFADARRGAQWHAVRVATIDAAVRRFLTEHPAGTVVALGEGLETQFWRVDNGTMRWLTVELPETLAVRRRLLPDGPRQHSYAGSALEPGWLDQVDPTGPVLVTAQGLLMYFQGEEVHQLITTIAERLPGSSMVLDVLPEAMLRMVGRRPDTEQATKLWTWVFNAGERAGIGAIPGRRERSRPDPATRSRDGAPTARRGTPAAATGALRATSVPGPRGRLPAAVTAAYSLAPDDGPVMHKPIRYRSPCRGPRQAVPYRSPLRNDTGSRCISPARSPYPVPLPGNRRPTHSGGAAGRSLGDCPMSCRRRTPLPCGVPLQDRPATVHDQIRRHDRADARASAHDHLVLRGREAS